MEPSCARVGQGEGAELRPRSDVPRTLELAPGLWDTCVHALTYFATLTWALCSSCVSESLGERIRPEEEVAELQAPGSPRRVECV